MTTIRGTVEPIRRLLVEELGVEHLAAVVDCSMGAMQALRLDIRAEAPTQR